MAVHDSAADTCFPKVVCNPLRLLCIGKILDGILTGRVDY